MKSNEIFNFIFVDRFNERQIIENYITTDNETDLLWLQGERGIGKTRLINYVLPQQHNIVNIYINSNINETEKDILLVLLNELEKYHNLSFQEYIWKNYKSIQKLTSQIVELTLAKTFPNLEKILEYFFDNTYILISKKNLTKEPVQVISDYINEILAIQKLFITFDNFTRCDNKSVQYILAIIKAFSNNSRIKFCIITTNEDEGMLPDLTEKLLSTLDVRIVKLKKFEKCEYFYQILEQNFNLNSLSAYDLAYIYNKCSGNPQKLTKILQKLYIQEGVKVNHSSKADIDFQKLNALLRENRFQLEKEDFPIKEKWILYTLVNLGKTFKIEELAKITKYLAENIFLFNILKENDFYEALYQLMEQRILETDAQQNVYFGHDEYYYDIIELFENEPIKTLFYHSLYRYFLENNKIISRLNQDISYSGLICFYAYKAREEGWGKINYFYGTSLYKKRQFNEAANIFVRLNDDVASFGYIEMLRIALCFYEAGSYEYARYWLDSINTENLHFPALKFIYHYYYAKIINNTEIAKDVAIAELNKAMEYTANNIERKVYTLNLLHLYHLETANGRKKAYSIFNDIKDNYRQSAPVAWANTMRGCQNFISGKDALELLNKAYDILDNPIEKAYIVNTKGFIYAKMDEWKFAQEKFNEAFEILRELKIHESSYAANNLAVMCMLSGNYEAALDILYNARIWCTTKYANLVIKVHMAVCYVYLKRYNEAENCIKELERLTIENIDDNVIKRKITINLGICYQKMNSNIEGTKILERALPWVKGTSSEYRLYKLLKIKTSVLPKTKYDKFSSFEPWFLIYAHD